MKRCDVEEVWLLLLDLSNRNMMPWWQIHNSVHTLPTLQVLKYTLKNKCSKWTLVGSTQNHLLEKKLFLNYWYFKKVFYKATK